MPRDFHELSRLEDSLSYLYIDKAIIERDENAIVIIRENERIPVPISSLTVLMLGPGTNLTHAAMRICAESGCLVIWCGENASRFYGYGMGETRSANKLLRQAEWCMNDEKHLLAVRRMFELRFPDMKLEGKSLQQIRGLEGVRVRETYKVYARKYGVTWKGRKYDQNDWDQSDELNQALSAANVCLYGLCNAAIVSLGYSPGLGFIHTGKMQSFVYDIADIYKMETSVPVAFETVFSGRTESISKSVRIAMRRALRERKVLKRIASDLAYIFDEQEDDDPNQNEAGHLWDGRQSIAGGKNYSEDA